MEIGRPIVHQPPPPLEQVRLEVRGTRLGHPYTSKVKGSSRGRMRELRVQSGGRPIRIFYAFDPRRTAILLIGGHKREQDRFYQQNAWRVDTT